MACPISSSGPCEASARPPISSNSLIAAVVQPSHQQQCSARPVNSSDLLAAGTCPHICRLACRQPSHLNSRCAQYACDPKC